jgi:NAD(P)-dependent dehydrogenase (short-subunit alcohol dehydrogenase family)
MTNIFSLSGKVAIMTGALGLLGRRYCYALAEAGAHVVVCDLDKKEVEEFSAALGKEHLGIVLDVTKKDSVEKAKDKILKQYGTIDILVNNAAINDKFEDPALSKNLSAFENYPLTSFDQSLAVNITGVFLCCQIFGKVMSDQKKGSIINIGSTYGMVGPDQTIYKNEQGDQSFFKSVAYPVTKGAVVNFTRFLAAYWGNHNVRVNTLTLGGVKNGQDSFFVNNYAKKTLLGRMASPDDYIGSLIFLASDASNYMTGSNLVIDGGWTAI